MAIKISARFQAWPQALWVAGAFLGGSVLLTQGIQAQKAPAFERVSFYFAAHEDDWQLFMNPSAFQDVADPKTKTVFVHTTAGDAGAAPAPPAASTPIIWRGKTGRRSRSASWRIGAASGRMEGVQRAVRRHPIYRVAYKNTAAFLRCPTAAARGPDTRQRAFIARSSRQGRHQRHCGDRGSTSYHGWSDLVSTLRGSRL
jgi:hypothetical protein